MESHGFDPGSQMIPVNNIAMENLPNVGPYAVIFGSLVLHDMLGEGAVDRFSEFLEEAKRVLTPGGSLVFADCFFSDRETKGNTT